MIIICWVCVYICYLWYAHITRVDSTAVPFSVFRSCTVLVLHLGMQFFTDG